MKASDCEEIIRIGKTEKMLERSGGFDDSTGQTLVNDYRTSQQVWLAIAETPLIAELERRIVEMTAIPVEHHENFQLAWYREGEEYKVHHDYFHDEYDPARQHIKRSGQRLITFMIYLNTLPEDAGGETDFVYSNVKIRPEQGKAVVFWNVMPNWEVDQSTYHAGLPPAPGYEKWLLTKWIRQNRFAF